MAIPVGVSTFGSPSRESPASMTPTRTLGSSDRRAARTRLAVPPPMMKKSKLSWMKSVTGVGSIVMLVRRVDHLRVGCILTLRTMTSVTGAMQYMEITPEQNDCREQPSYTPELSDLGP